MTTTAAIAYAAVVEDSGSRISSGEEKTALERLEAGEGYRSDYLAVVNEQELTYNVTAWRHPAAGVWHGGDSGATLECNLSYAGETKSAESSPSLSRRPKRTTVLSGKRRASMAPPNIKTEHDDDAATEVAEAEAHNLPQPPPALLGARRGITRGKRIYQAGNRTNKWVTREIAALDFLTGVPMRNEAAVRACPTSGTARGARVTGYGSPSREQHHKNFGYDSSPSSSTMPGGVTGGEGVATTNAGGFPSGLSQPTVNKHDDDDSDSEGGWLDQPLPHGAPVGRGVTAPRRESPTAANWGGGISGAGVGSPAPARRLRGQKASHIRVPLTFRHRMRRLPGHSAAVVRQWEQGLTKQERLLEGRMFFSSSKGYPLMVSSVLHYQPEEEEAKRVRQKWIDERGAEAFQIPKRDWRGYSYAHLLRPLHRRSVTTGGISSGDLGADVGSIVGAGGPGGGSAALDHSDAEGAGSGVGGRGNGGGGEGGEAPYTAGFLDDPALTLGKHRHMTRGDQNTGPMVSSVLLFVKPRVLKDGLNAQFREKHPNLPPSLTLSKIRSVKRQALLGCHRAGMEVATVALACVYFERLCLAGVVTKPNRRLAMATCLAIAYKFNEPVLMEGVSKLPALWAFVDQEWTVNKKRVLEAEFGVLVQLSFNLHEDPRDVFYHFVLLLKMIESHPTLYLGEEMIALHQESLETYFRDFVHDEGSGATGGAGGDATGGDGGGESPRAKAFADGGALGVDARPRAMSSQESPAWMGRAGWLQRRPAPNASRWLAGWRGSQEEGPGARAAATGQPRNLGKIGADLSRSQPGQNALGRLERLKQAGQGLGKGMRQRRQRLNKNVRDGASSLARQVSTRRRSRRKMET